MISVRPYGAVAQLSQKLGICRQTLYNWANLGRQALEQIFQPSLPATSRPDQFEPQVLTLLVEGHASYRGIQARLRCFGQELSLGSIAKMVKVAQQRVQLWLATHVPTSSRNVALAEIFGKQRGVAHLSMVVN